MPNALFAITLFAASDPSPAGAGSTAATLFAASDPSPADVFALVGSAIANGTKTHGCINATHSDHSCSFGKWSYGDAIINSELIAARASLGLDFRAFTDAKLDYWTATPGAVGYELANNISIEWGYSIGDVVGLYPISYLARGLAAAPGGGDNPDVALALAAARRYILQWPRRWSDGTISRDTGDNWPGEADQHGSFIWGDDAFMGLTLVSRLVAAGAVSGAELAEFRDFAAEQHRLLSAHLVDGEEGLYFHGFNAGDRHFSCCKWGRANGWAMMAHVETLGGMVAGSAPFNATLATLAAHAHAVRQRQPTADRTDGRWHQLLNDTSTYLETSCTAMFTYSWATAVMRGWLDRATFDAPIRAAWRGLLKTVDVASGQVSGICNGFGIHANADAYSKCSTNYFGSAPGLGSVLRAARAMHDYEQSGRE